VRLNLFWKLGFAFFALLIAVLLPVDFFAERALRRDYESAGFEQLSAIARIALANPPQALSLATASSAPVDRSALRDWVAKMAASTVRVTVIAADGQVLADSQSDPSTMENHAGRPEIRDAFAKGDGQSIRYSVTIKRNLLYYAVRLSSAGAPPVVLRFALPISTPSARCGATTKAPVSNNSPPSHASRWQTLRRLHLSQLLLPLLSIALLCVTGSRKWRRAPSVSR